MGGKTGFRSYPRHLRRNRGKGYKECAASGFLRPVSQMMEDVRQGDVARDMADITPGFGTNHPQDVVQLGQLDDPTPIDNAQPPDKRNLTKSDLLMSDQEIRLSIEENRPPRIGF